MSIWLNGQVCEGGHLHVVKSFCNFLVVVASSGTEDGSAGKGWQSWHRLDQWGGVSDRGPIHGVSSFLLSHFTSSLLSSV